MTHRPSAFQPSDVLMRLGLIGDNIARSRAPDLHRLAGELVGLPVSYERLIPPQLGQTFDDVFESCANGGYRGINITYPYKEVAARKVRAPDPLVREVGAVNTVIFGPNGAEGHNTDLTGFMAAYREAHGTTPPGTVALVGAGGVGKAIAFALLGLGATRLCLTDLDTARANGLASALSAASSRMQVSVVASAEAAVRGADGVVNCTPVGMVGHEGTPVPAGALAGLRWAFDAVYTPVDTQFLRDAAAAGVQCISGFELFFHQGVQAFRIFTGRDVPPTSLRQLLAASTSTQQGKQTTHA